MARTNVVRKTEVARAAVKAAKGSNVADLSLRNMRGFGVKVGKHDSDSSLIAEANRQHAIYAKADDAGKKKMKAQFMVGYLSAVLSISVEDAGKVLVNAAKNTPDEVKAKKAGSMAFLHRVAQTGAKKIGGRAANPKKARRVSISADQRKVLERLWTTVSGKTIADQRDNLKAMIDKLAAEYVAQAEKEQAE